MEQNRTEAEIRSIFLRIFPSFEISNLFYK